LPLQQKLIKLGVDSRGVILPRSWVRYYEEERGEKITKVLVETEGAKLIITLPKLVPKKFSVQSK